MGTFGEVKIGRISLREDSEVSVAPNDFGSATIQISGQESRPRLNALEIKQRLEDIIALRNRFVPVSFSQKPEMNAYYFITSAAGSYDSWVDHNLSVFPWNITMERVGFDNELDLESRLSGPITRANNFSAVGERWLAPPIGHYGFFSGSATPPTVTRAGEDGNVVVYRGLGVTNNPRYGCSISDSIKGRVRLLDSNGLERVGEQISLSPAGWMVTNGLIRVSAPAIANGNLRLEAYHGGSWRSKDWDIQDTSNFGEWTGISVLINEPEQVTIRLLHATATGRRTLDLTIKRGSRILEGYLQRNASGTLAVKLHAAEAGTVTSGYIYATAVDAFSLRYLIGSARTFTADAPNGKISIAATLSLDFFLSITVDVPTDGDEAADLYAQYLGTPAETVTGVRR